MGDRRALAGMDILGRQHEIELALFLNDIAFAHGAGDNRNHGKPLKSRDLRGSLAGSRGQNKWPGGSLRPMPTAALCWLSGAGSRPGCGAFSRIRASAKWNAASWRSRPAMRRICMLLKPLLYRPMAAG